MEIARLNSVFRAVRLRKGWRQADVARAARTSRSQVARCESHDVVQLKLETITRVAAALEVNLDITVRWRGAALDRLLNAAHSALHDRVAGVLASADGWRFVPEATFSIYGERGVIDILAFHQRTGALLVIELKTVIVDIQQLIGQVDRYVRLATTIAHERGWKPGYVSAWVIVADTSTSRRRIEAHADVMRSAFPTSGREMRAWLANPTGPVHGLSFMSSARPTGIGRKPASRMRASAPRAGSSRAQIAGQPAKGPAPAGSGSG